MPYEFRQTHTRTRGRSGREVSGQYRVTVPDPDTLDRLRTQNRVYDHTLTPRDRFAGSVPIGVCSLPGSSRESSTEPMDMDEGARITRKIAESVRVARGRVHSDSEGYLPDTVSQSLSARGRREGPESMATRGETSGDNPRRGQSVTELPTLLQIPLCVTAGPPEEGDLSLHQPALVDPAHNLDQREDPRGACPKVRPRFSTQTIAEEAQGFQGGTDFYLPLIGQPRISEVCAWRAPVCTEQGNPGIYIQADEWQETYGGNVFVVDEVTGRMYVLRGDTLERIPEVTSRRRRDEHSLSATPHVPGESAGLQTPAIGNTSVPIAESTRQPQSTPGSTTLTVTGEGTTPPDREGEKDIPQNPRPATETPRGREEGRRTLEMGPRTEDRKSPECSGHSDDRKRQVTILRDYVGVLRKECDRLEAKLLNEHIHQVSVGGLHGSALEELREETQREYATLLRKELQPTLEYFELINEELMEEIPLKEEDDPNFDYPAGYDWREGDYMWLLFKIQQHFAHQNVWNGIFSFINRTQPLRRASHEQAMVELTESWQELFDKSIRVKRIARRALEATGRDEGVHPRGSYEEQPPADTLIPPNILAREEPRGTPEKKGTKGTSLPKRNESSPGAFPNEKSQAEAHQSAVEAVRRITSSCSSLESSNKSEKGGMAGGDWDPTYDGFALDERGPRTITSPSEGHKIRGPQNNKDTEGRGETPKGRPLPTLREIHQMNLRRVLEEERAEVPCDICGSQDHDYRHCQAGALLESRMPGTPQPGQNDDRGNPSQGSCGWCKKKGHISLECPTKFYSQSMKERFPTVKKRRKSKILEYTCRRCGEQHPFNRYCPYAVEPPIVPGECRS